jgi:hypothetical protein
MTTMERDRHVIVTRRKNRKGENVEVHYYRPQRDFKRTLAGTDPLTVGYQRSLGQAQDAYARWLAMGSPPRTASAMPRALS